LDCIHDFNGNDVEEEEEEEEEEEKEDMVPSFCFGLENLRAKSLCACASTLCLCGTQA
jgi:hypothetical protein